MGENLDAAHVLNLLADIRGRGGRLLHARVVELALETFDFCFFLFELGFQGLGWGEFGLGCFGCPILARFLRKGGRDETGDEILQFVILAKMTQ